MRDGEGDSLPANDRVSHRRLIVPALGAAQILAWGSTYYLLAVLATPITDDTGWPLAWVVGGLSLGMLVAGIVSPYVGDRIQRFGGRRVLATSAVLLSAGLTGMAFSPSLPAYIASWLLLGAGMGAGLYDAVFATLGRLFGRNARSAIAGLTLVGGFASTLCWPLSAMLVSLYGWRATCLIYAGMHLGILVPLYMLALPAEPRKETINDTTTRKERSAEAGAPIKVGSRLSFVLIASIMTIGSMISALLSVHLITLLQFHGLALAAAVALGALVGPAQVGARGIEFLFGRYYHPVWTMFASSILVAAGIGLLWTGLPLPAAALILYGAGVGIEWIARGTLPLAVFGERNYPALMGRIAMPSLIGQAASPFLGAMLIGRIGGNGVLAVLFAAAVIKLAFVGFLALRLNAKVGESRPMP